MIEDSFTAQLRHEPLDDLRKLRDAMREEERRVSYWRRLIQGRLDLVRAALTGERPGPDDLARLAAARHHPDGERRSPRAARLLVDNPGGAVSELEALWDTPIPWDDPAALPAIERSLVETEVELSACRRALHRRIDACTTELVGRYQRDPSQVPAVVPLT